jgi:DNA-binding NarL/FixJ family response regulator
LRAVPDGPAAPLRISLVDDATAMRVAAPTLLPEDVVVSTHSCVEELLAAAPPADVAVLDLHLAHQGQRDVLQGVSAVSAVVAAGYLVCVYTQEERRFVLASCLAAGARGVVSKATPLAETRAAFAAVARGELVAPPAVIGVLEVLSRRGHLTLLSDRQRAVLNGRARGLTYAELARVLFVSPSTLRGYWHEVTQIVGQHLGEVSPGDIEHAFGLRPGDLVGVWPTVVSGRADPSSRPAGRRTT